MFESKITGIGKLVEDFKKEMLVVLFRDNASEQLKEISVIHNYIDSPDGVLEVGSKIELGNNIYTITKVGEIANKNFQELGHISIYFRDGDSEILPGSITVEPAIFPKLEVGQKIKVY